MKVAVYGRKFEDSFIPYINEFFNKLDEYNCVIQLYEPFADFLNKKDDVAFQCLNTFTNHDELDDQTEFLFTVGGDGTFLESLPIVQNKNIPVIGLNSGRLGFLANISKENITEAVKALINKDYHIEERTLLQVDLFGADIELYNIALNDITIQKTDNTLIEVKTYIDNEFVTTYWTDGIIVATPTGSTAYSLSVGGPIVSPGSSNIIISPIASHNLSMRPMVISDNVVLDFEVFSRNNKFILTLDNRNFILDQNVKLRIKKSGFALKLLQLKGNSYYKTLRHKLMWGADSRN